MVEKTQSYNLDILYNFLFLFFFFLLSYYAIGIQLQYILFLATKIMKYLRFIFAVF